MRIEFSNGVYDFWTVGLLDQEVGKDEKTILYTCRVRAGNSLTERIKGIYDYLCDEYDFSLENITDRVKIRLPSNQFYVDRWTKTHGLEFIKDGFPYPDIAWPDYFLIDDDYDWQYLLSKDEKYELASVLSELGRLSPRERSDLYTDNKHSSLAKKVKRLQRKYKKLVAERKNSEK